MLLYGCEAWSILDNCHKTRIQILKNKCLRLIFYAPRYTRISQLHEVANLSYIDELMEYNVQKMYNIINKHDNPLVQSIGHFNQRHVKHRNIFLGVPPAVTEDDNRVG